MSVLLCPSPGVFCEAYRSGPVGSPNGIPAVYHYLAMRVGKTCEKAAVFGTFS